MNTDSIRNNLWKWVALAIVAVASIYITLPLKDVKDENGKVVEEGKIRLGLDLRGGSSFTLGVDKAKLAETITASLVDKGQTNALGEVDSAVVNAKVEETLKNSDTRIVEVVRRRIDGMGMNEPVIQSLQDHRLLVQLPGVDDATRKQARESIQKAAFLQFRLVHANNDTLVSNLMRGDAAPEGYKKVGNAFIRADNYLSVSKKPGYATRLAAFHAPARYQLMLQKEKDNTYRPAFVSRKTELTGDYIVKAGVRHDLAGYAIDFELNAEGGDIFRKLTGNYIAHGNRNKSDKGRQLAIVLDDMLISAPVLQSEISTNGQITGNFTAEEAQELANNLNAGALPAPLEILSESSVSPTVGDEAISAGYVAAILGFLLVAVFMFVYYRTAGLVANVALFLDIALLPAALILVANVLGVFAQDVNATGAAFWQLPVLTMPGIAGLVLTLGMAVDANVLIFERIREEFRNKGTTVGTALANGYGRAFTAIFDSNITTILTGAILFIVGTGPVRGYAIMLTAGVIISMFTAVLVTRIILDLATKPESTKPFKMLQFFQAPNIDFVKLGKKTILASAIVVVVTLAIFFGRALVNPASVLAVDLTGGTSIVYNYDEAHKPAEADLRKALAPFDNAAIIQFQDGGVGKASLLVKTGYTTENGKEVAATEDGKVDVEGKVTSLISAAAPDANFTVASNDEVGSVVGADLKKSGTWAVLLSLAGILIYVGLRFEFGFGLGAIVALAHDALVALGLYSLCGRQVSLIVITALLTIVGYSVNDTIVVFDRIREDLRKDQRTSFKDLCNRAINQTLSRTVITSLTTFFAVLALFAFGDGSIFDFALVMLFGVVAGTYSSMFIATPVMMWFYRGKRPEFDSEEKTNEQ